METFEVILEQYEPMLKSLLTRLHIYKDFSDYYQEARIGLWLAYERYNSNLGTFSSFAYTTVKGELMKSMEKDRKYCERFPTVPDNHIANPTFDIYKELDAQIVHDLCHSCSERQKIWVQKHLFEGKTITEIAEEEQTTRGAVKSWRRSALKKIRIELETKQ
ncbi:sigma-70 family RNA polymerase sigma factor [Bacillus tianshenii]|nr:sigma-70 family RNA polymerase sigma factor [Bacillus tianshenii]